MKSQNLKNPEKNYQAIHNELINCQVSLIFEFKVMVNKLIELIDELKLRYIIIFESIGRIKYIWYRSSV